MTRWAASGNRMSRLNVVGLPIHSGGMARRVLQRFETGGTLTAMTTLLNQRDLASWNDLIAEAIHEPDALLSNLKVTRAHYLLSLALR